MSDRPDNAFTTVESVVREALRFFPECFVQSLRQSSTRSIVVHIGCHETRHGYSSRPSRLALLRSFVEGRLRTASFNIEDCAILRDCMTIQVRSSNETPVGGAMMGVSVI